MSYWIAILIGMSTPIIFGVIAWFIVNHKRLPDKFNLMFRRARVVKVNFLTAAGKNFVLFRVPDRRGNFNIRGGFYVYPREQNVYDAYLRVPEVSFLEGQIHAVTPEILENFAEIPVKVEKDDGSIVTEIKKVPFYVASYRGLSPEKLKEWTSQEVMSALNSHIIEDIINASAKQLQRLELMFYLMIALVIIALVGFAITWNNVSDVKELLGGIQRAAP